MTKKINWETIEKQYTQGTTTKNGKTHYPTLKQLSKTHNITESTLQNKSATNHWTQKRKIAKMGSCSGVLEVLSSDFVGGVVRVEDVDRVNGLILGAVSNIVRGKVDVVDFDVLKVLKDCASVLESVNRVASARDRLEKQTKKEEKDRYKYVQKVIGSDTWKDMELKILDSVDEK